VAWSLVRNAGALQELRRWRWRCRALLRFSLQSGLLDHAQRIYPLSNTHVEKKIFGEKKFSSPRRIFCHVNRFNSDEDRERWSSGFQDRGLVLFAALGCALVFLVFFVRIVLPGCAFQSELSVIFGAVSRSGSKERGREGGREGGRGEQEEELKNSFLLFLLLVVGVASLLLLDAYLCANSFSKFKRRERWREPD